MITITFTEEQAAAIVETWNALANEANQLTPDEAYLLVTDKFEHNIEEFGEHTVEVRGTKSASGRPELFTISIDEVTVEQVCI